MSLALLCSGFLVPAECLSTGINEGWALKQSSVWPGRMSPAIKPALHLSQVSSPWQRCCCGKWQLQYTYLSHVSQTKPNLASVCSSIFQVWWDSDTMYNVDHTRVYVCRAGKWLSFTCLFTTTNVFFFLGLFCYWAIFVPLLHCIDGWFLVCV